MRAEPCALPHTSATRKRMGEHTLARHGRTLRRMWAHYGRARLRVGSHVLCVRIHAHYVGLHVSEHEGAPTCKWACNALAHGHAHDSRAHVVGTWAYLGAIVGAHYAPIHTQAALVQRPHTHFARSLTHKAKPSRTRPHKGVTGCAHGHDMMRMGTHYATRWHSGTTTHALWAHSSRNRTHLGANGGVGGSPCVSGNFRRKLGCWEGSVGRPRSRLHTHLHVYGRKPEGFHFCTK